MSDDNGLGSAQPFTEGEFEAFEELYYQTSSTGHSHKNCLEPDGDYNRLFATAALSFKKRSGH